MLARFKGNFLAAYIGCTFELVVRQELYGIAILGVGKSLLKAVEFQGLLAANDAGDYLGVGILLNGIYRAGVAGYLDPLSLHDLVACRDVVFKILGSAGKVAAHNNKALKRYSGPVFASRYREQAAAIEAAVIIDAVVYGAYSAAPGIGNGLAVSVLVREVVFAAVYSDAASPREQI